MKEISRPRGSVRDDGVGGRQREDVGRAKILVATYLRCGICKKNMGSERREKTVCS